MKPILLAMASLIASTWTPAEGRSTSHECVAVRVLGAELVRLQSLTEAEATASGIFDPVGVSLEWKTSPSRSSAPACVTIQAEFVPYPPAGVDPAVLANARPYSEGGTQINFFVNRILHCPSARQNGVLLGYVMAHEIAHVLEGISRHSDNGVMKARWTGTDYPELFARSLRFARADADLIQSGLSNRRKRSSVTSALR